MGVGECIAWLPAPGSGGLEMLLPSGILAGKTLKS